MQSTKFQEANLSHNFLFQELLKEKEIFQAIYEEILQNKLGELKEVIREPRLGNSIYTHEIQCDLSGITTEGILCNLEIQNRPMKYFLNRARYYASMLQANYYFKQENEEPYENVPKCYSIWLCNFDPFGDQTERNTIVPYREEMGMVMEDGVMRIFIDIRKWEKFSTKLQELFKFILDSSEENGLHAKWDIVQLLYKNMMRIKENNGKEREFMQFNKAREIGYIDGWYEGREEGIEQGIEKGIETTIVNMYLEGLDFNLIAKVTKCSVEDVKKIVDRVVVA